ncbi:MAG: thioredoxin domain-containing protein [Actinomycetia bacterium]|nr:thioredoxin domain-containing protein [Actinomycetes bacterium]
MAKKKSSNRSGSRRPATAEPARPRLSRAQQLAEREAAIAAQNRRRRALGIGAGLLLLALVATIAGYGWWRSNRAIPSAAPSAAGTASSAAAGSASPSSTQPAVGFAPVTIQPGQGVRIGSAEAPNVVAVYLDFHCGHCQTFESAYGPTLNRLTDSGRVAVEYWPLGFLSAGSKSASNAFACAAERDPGFGRELHDAVFRNQQAKWSDEQLLGLSRQLRPTLPEGYEACVTDKPHLAWVDGIFKAATNGGPVTEGTPTVTVNGQPFDLTTGTPTALVERLV